MSESIRLYTNPPHYVVESTDIVANKLPTANKIGGIVYIKDTNETKMITEDLTLADYKISTSAYLEEGGNVIGAVEIKDATTDDRMSVDANGSIATKIDQVTANANEVVTKTGSVTTATLNAETTKVIGTVNDKIADGDNVALGSKTDAASTTGDTTPSSVIAMLKGIWNKLGAVVLGGSLPAGTNNIGDVDVVTLPTLPAGDNNIGNIDIVTLPALPTGTNTIGNVVLKDGAGNSINSRESLDGSYHLGTMIQQVVYEDTNNSSTTNLDAGNSYTFTGTGTNTLIGNGLQWNLKTDQNATVYIEQSDDNTNWDITDSFQFITAKGGAGNTVQSITAYWRIRVVLDTTVDTTYFRLKAVICPITQPLPRALSPDSRMKTETVITGQQNTERHAWITPVNELAITPRYRLVGSSFTGTTKDTNFWTETVANGGTVVQSAGEIKLQTNTTADATTQYQTVHKGRFVPGYPILFQGAVSFVTAKTANNVRMVGVYDAVDGYFFQLDNETFSVGVRKASSDTLVSSGSFNGNYGDTWSPEITEDYYYKMSVEFGSMSTFWYVNNILLHTSMGGHQIGDSTLPVTIENNNSNGSTSDIEFHCTGALISREGQLQTESVYKYIAGATTTVLKYGAGTLHSIVNNDNSGSIIVYDNTAGSGTIIASIDLVKVLGTQKFDAPFSNGLTVVSTGGGVKITVTYE